MFSHPITGRRERPTNISWDGSIVWCAWSFPWNSTLLNTLVDRSNLRCIFIPIQRLSSQFASEFSRYTLALLQHSYKVIDGLFSSLIYDDLAIKDISRWFSTAFCRFPGDWVDRSQVMDAVDASGGTLGAARAPELLRALQGQGLRRLGVAAKMARPCETWSLLVQEPPFFGGFTKFTSPRLTLDWDYHL